MAFNVLVADDSKTTRSIIIKALSHAGVQLGEIREAADGEAALQILSDSWIDIVFVDINMPVMTGTELIQRMAANSLIASIPVVIVSTEGRQDRIDALLASGAAAFIRKPFSPQQVIETARELLLAPLIEPAPDALQDAFYGAIEGFAMLVAIPLDETPAPPTEAVFAQMSFVGPASRGRVALAMPKDGCETIAVSATGSADANGGCDGVLELLNVVSGHLVESLPGGSFSLDLPTAETRDGESVWTEIEAMQVSLAFDVEGLTMLVGYTLDGRW